MNVVLKILVSWFALSVVVGLTVGRILKAISNSEGDNPCSY